MTQEIVTEFLRDVGLNENEIKIYYFLARFGPQKANGIIKKFRMHKMQVYRYLQDMEKKGVVTLFFGAPKRFIATPIDDLLNEKMQNTRIILEKLEKHKREISDNWDNFLANRGETNVERYAVIQGEKKLHTAVEGLRSKAREELCGMIKLKCLVRANLAGDYNKIIEGKVPFRWRVLTQTTNESVPQSKEVLQRLSQSPKVDIRLISAKLDPFPCFCLTDSEEIVLITANHEDLNSDVHSLWTNNRIIVGLIKNYFEKLWETAEAVETFLQAPIA
jgi:sugar-specific transcriptional regulator TrmB